MLSRYAKWQNSADSLIKVLKLEIQNKKTYENERSARILALKNDLAKVLPANSRASKFYAINCIMNIKILCLIRPTF